MGTPVKQAIIYLVDVSRTMGHPCLHQPTMQSEEDATTSLIKKELISQPTDPPAVEGQADPPLTKLDLARQFVVLSLHQKALDRPKSFDIGVILYGSDNTHNMCYDAMDEEDRGDYQYVDEILPMIQPRVDGVRKADAALQHTFNRSGDLVGALVTAVFTMDQVTGKRRCQRHIFLVSDLESPIKEADRETLKGVVERMKDQGIDLTYVGFDLNHQQLGDVKPEEQSQGDSRQMRIKRENEKMIKSVVGAVGGQCMDALASLGSLEYFSKKTRSTAFNMTIQLTHELVFAAKYGGATMEARPPILKKAHKQDDEGGVGELTMEVTYQTTAEGQEHEVDIGDRGKGYLYGPEYVPFSKDDEDNFKIHTDKAEMKVLGFVNESDVPRHTAMSNTVFVIPPEADKHACRVLSAFVTALHDDKKFAIVRFVRRKNADPEVGALIPVTDSTSPYFYYQKLPFEDDVRPYRFPSLREPLRKEHKPTDEQLKVASDLVDSLFVKGPLPEIHNPTLYLTSRTIAAKSLDPEAPIQPLHPVIRQAFEPDPGLWKSARPSEAATAFLKAFPVSKVVSKRARAAQGLAWGQRDVEESEEKRARTEGEEADGGEAAVTSNVKLTSVTALNDFPKIIEEGNEADLKVAIQQMQVVIGHLIESNVRRAVAHVKKLREGCVKVLEAEAFNSYLKDLLAQRPPGGEDAEFWEEMVREGVSLITKEEGQTELDTTHEDAQAFLQDMQKKEEVVGKVEAPVEEAGDDMELE